VKFEKKSKKSTFFHIFFFIKESQKETFFDILDRKKCFLDLKSDVSKKVQKKRHFPKGLVHSFCQKKDVVLLFLFLSKESLKNTFFDIVDRKQCFLYLKSEVLKKGQKIDILQRG